MTGLKRELLKNPKSQIPNLKQYQMPALSLSKGSKFKRPKRGQTIKYCLDERLSFEVKYLIFGIVYNLVLEV